MTKTAGAAGARRCGNCDRPIAKAHAVHDGVPWCGTCYARVFLPDTCTGCGGRIRTPDGVSGGLCRSCRARGRSCLRCGKPVRRAGLTLPDGVACASCARYFKPPRPCAVCGRLSIRLARDLKRGFTEPTCESCRSRDKITCPGCGKHRRPEGTDAAGRLVCRLCLELGTFVCPRCGREGRRHSARRCEACYWEDRVAGRVAEMADRLRTPRYREAFAVYADDLAKRVGAQRASLRLRRDFEFFERMDSAMPDPHRVDEAGLIGLFGTMGVRRMQMQIDHAIRIGLIPPMSQDTLAAARCRAAVETVIARSRGRWYHDVLVRFRDHLETVARRWERRGWTGERRRPAPSSMRNAVQSAEAFLKSIPDPGVAVIGMVGADAMDRFLARNPGQRSAITPFVRYLNRHERAFARIRIPMLPAQLARDAIIPADRVAAIVARCLDGSVPAREALILLLMLLHAQRPVRIARLRLTDLSRGRDGVHRLRIRGGNEIALDEAVGGVAGRYLIERRPLAPTDDGGDNPWLFPGRTAGGHLTAEAVRSHADKWGFKAQQAFSTALFNACESGMRHPKMLMRAFGVSVTCAMKYVSIVDPRLRYEADGRLAEDPIDRDSGHAESERVAQAEPAWWLYMIECRGGGIYTGIAIDVDRRYEKHAAGKGARYTRINPPVRLLCRHPFPDRGSAARAEYAIKRLPVDRKWRLAMSGSLDGEPSISMNGR